MASSPTSLSDFKRLLVGPDLSTYLSRSKTPRRGIYILEFADGSRYVGQTKDLARRVREHRRHSAEELVAVSFAPTLIRGMHDAELRTIRWVEDAGLVMRNLADCAMPSGICLLDDVLDRAWQDRWLDAPTELGGGERVGVESNLRPEECPRTSADYKGLSRHPRYGEILGLLACYVHHAIPAPGATDGKFWVVSSRPTAPQGRGSHRLVTIYANKYTAFTLSENIRTGRLEGQFTVSSAAFRIEQSVSMRVGFDNETAFRVEKYGFDEGNLARHLERSELVRRARSFVLGLMRQGPSVHARHHDYQLAADILAVDTSGRSPTPRDGGAGNPGSAQRDSLSQ